MSALVQGARRLLGRESGVDARLDALASAAELARGRVDGAVLADVDAVVARASDRLRLSADHTVVAIAGATGSGKSSTFNALAGLDLAAVGVRRPTTTHTSACVWPLRDPDAPEVRPGEEPGDDPATTALLDWLEVSPRHRTSRESVLGSLAEDEALRGVVLLDLPDHDSTEVAHHVEVRRLAELADLMVWVLDPQKYADAAVHRQFLEPMAGHQDVLLVALNQVDRVPGQQRDDLLADVRRLLDGDGLDRVPLLPMSARTGAGVAELRAEVARRGDAKRSSRDRLLADLRGAAERLEAAAGSGRPRDPGEQGVAGLHEAVHDALAEAAGVPAVVEAVERSTRLRARRATGWPLTSWASRLRRDPGRRLSLDVPEPTGVHRATVDAAVRQLADGATGDMRGPWAEQARRAASPDPEALRDGLDRAFGGVDLDLDRLPWWVRGVRLLQWLLLGVALVGGGWLLGLAAAGFLQLSLGEPPDLAGLPAPTLLLLGGAGAGLALAALGRPLVSAAARSRARRVDRRLRRGVEDVAAELVVGPLEQQLADYRQVRADLARVRG